MSSPSTSWARSRAASSCSAETGEKTAVTATASAVSRTLSRKRAAASRSNGASSRPSNSEPPPTIASPAETARRRSSGQAEQRRHRARRRRAEAQHRDALQAAPLEQRVRRVRRPEHDVRDAMRGSDRLGRRAPARAPRGCRPSRPASSASWPTRARVSSRSSTTASVFVPPTSMPTRRSDRRTQHLDRDVVEVVAEGPRARRPRCRAASARSDRTRTRSTVTRWP